MKTAPRLSQSASPCYPGRAQGFSRALDGAGELLLLEGFKPRARKSHGCPDLVFVTMSSRLHQRSLPQTQLWLCTTGCKCHIPAAHTGPVPLAMLTGHLVMSSGHSCGSIEAGCSHTLQQQKAEISQRNYFPQHQQQAGSPRKPPHCPCPKAVVPQLPSVPGKGLVTRYITSAKAGLIKATASFQ